MALSLKLPLIRIVEGLRRRFSKTIETTGRANVPEVEGWDLVVKSMGTIPRIALGLGSVAGLGAAHLLLNIQSWSKISLLSLLLVHL